MKRIKPRQYPLPLLQINPPKISETNRVLSQAYTSGNFSNSGNIQKEVSATLAGHVNSSLRGELVSNNTIGLTAALLAIGVKGKHVLLSNFTFAATLQSILLAGGIPVVCDVDDSTLELEPEIIRGILSCGKYNLAAVVPTRVLGYINDFSPLVELCGAFNIPVVVDAAATFPSKSAHWEFDHQATYEVFSFHATKVFGIGEGGLVVGKPADVKKVNEKINFGFTTANKIEFTEGLNAKADEFTSARAKVRFSNYEKDCRRRREFACHYEDLVSKSNQLTCLTSNEKTIFAYFPIIFQESKQLIRFKNALDQKVSSRRYYFPTIYRGYKGKSDVIFESDLDVSEKFAPKILCLPVYTKYSRRIPTQLIRDLTKILDVIS